jgi:tRNA A-37 threonylcarbamoyl transferase component Bud32
VSTFFRTRPDDPDLVIKNSVRHCVTMTGERFGPYRLDELIGRGGMGEVYRAYDTAHDRTVAVKRLPAYLAEDRAFRAQFRRESQIVARLREPHIIPIHDFGEIDGRLFLEMRLVDGVDLASLLRRDGPLPPSRAVAIVAQVASALEAAHAEQLVHRDVKPGNVLVDEAQLSVDHAYLVDFGIARDTSATDFGPAGGMVGSVEYMAPEQFTGGPPTPKVDVYSLGCLLYVALTGHTPFTGDGPAAQMYAHLHQPAPAPSELVADLPSELDAVTISAMAKDPADRPASAVAFAAAAHAALRTPEAPARPSWGFGMPRVPGLGVEPPFLGLGRRFADEALAMASGLGITPERVTATEQGPLRISLFVAEEMSRKTINAVSEAFWRRLRTGPPPGAAIAPSDGAISPSDGAIPGSGAAIPGSGGAIPAGGAASEVASAGTAGVDPAQTMVFTTRFAGDGDQTVVEVRIPVAALEGSELDVRELITQAHAAAAERTGSSTAGTRVTVRTDPHGTAFDVTSLPADDDSQP